jgi:ketosteroid isomerase-like protein
MSSFNLLIQNFFLVFIGLILAGSTLAQTANAEIEAILAQRHASNAALRQFDEDLNATFSTEDAFITTGAGTLIAGKKALQDYIKNASGPKMYWVRTPDEIKVNPDTQLAWELGTWEGFYENSPDSVVGGNYAAQWTKKSGIWLIQSQLFVTLPIE